MEHTPTSDALADELSGQLDFVQRLARSLVRDEQIAEDVVQETMLAAVARRPDPDSGMRAWLASVLRRRVLLHFRTEQRRVARETMLLRESEGRGVTGAEAEAKRADLSLERSSMLGRAVADLGEPYRTVVVMRHLEGLPPREIARRLDRSVHTVNTQLQRGLDRLRRSLDASHGGDRRAWVAALLPHALRGPKGWWPPAVRSVAGVSHGGLGVAAAVLASLVGAWLAARPDARAEASDLGVAEAAPAAAGGPAASIDAVPDAPAPARTPAPVADRRDAAAGVLVLEVRGPDGPLPGARIIAHQEASGERRFGRVRSVVEGPDGFKLKVGSRLLRVEVAPEDAGVSETAAGVTDAEGVARLPVLDGRPWRVEASADRFASSEIVVQERATEAARSILLAPATLVEVDRGAFPLESTVFVHLASPFDGNPRSGVLSSGLQDLRITRVETGRHVLEALSSRGNEVALWYLPVEVTGSAVTRVDLSMGGNSRAQIDIRGASASAPAHFVHVHGPDVEPDRPLWRRVAAVHDGLADLRALPPGRAYVRVLSRDAEIGRATLEIPEGESEQRVRVDIARGGLRVIHPGRHGDGLEWRLERRSDGPWSRQGWLELGKPLTGDGESRFHGLEGGEYRLGVIGGPLALRREFTVEGGEVAEIDLATGAADEGDVTPVEVVRGEGLAAGAPVELEFAPGEWEALTPDDGAVRLSPGTHHLRIALTGVGYARREVRVPGAGAVVFAQASRPEPLTVRCDNAGKPLDLRVVEDDRLNHVHRLRGAPLRISADGTGVLALRPGSYVASDRWGRRAELEVRPGVTSARIEFE